MPFDGSEFTKTSPLEIPIRESDTVLVLQEALRLIKKGWGKCAMAKCWWIPVPVTSWFATRYCASGAIRRAGYNLDLSINDAIWAMQCGSHKGIIHWNDSGCTTKTDVIALFEHIIRIEKAKNAPPRKWARDINYKHILSIR